MRAENIVLNKVPNCNDAMHVGNNVHLTAMGTQKFSMVAVQPSCRKADLPEMRDNDTRPRKVHVCENKLCPEKQ